MDEIRQFNFHMHDQENEIFRLAFDFIEYTSQHLFLTGKAGTGKTTFLKYLRKHSRKQVLVAAPTGVAAINANGVTLHSLFQLSFDPFIPNSRIKDSYKFGKAKRDLLQQMELLVIDEVSMLRADVLDAIDATLRFIRRNKKPFGGAQILYIGDMFQLPPVVKEDEWTILKNYYPTPFFFHAKVIEQTLPIYVELKKVYRQLNQQFIDLLNRLRNNILTSDDMALLNKHYNPSFIPSDGEKYITLTTHNYQADHINTQKLELVLEPLFVFSGEITGDFPDYSLPTEMHLRLKKGAQVMFIKNDLNNDPPRYFNGKIAEITRINHDEIYALPEGTDEEVKVEKETWENVRYKLKQATGEIEEEKIGSFRQYALRLAWAITIHKSQGLTFNRAIIDIGRAFAAGQAYVALSRCTSIEGVILQSPVTPNCIQTDEYAVTLKKSEKSIEELNALLETGKQEFQKERLLQYFDWSTLLRLLREFQSFTENKISDELQSAHELSMQLYLKAKEQQKIAGQFQKQLEFLVEQTRKENDLFNLKERCCKAVTYFYDDIRLNIVLPLQIHKSGFTKQKKAKAYWKFLNELEVDIILFINRLKTIYYNDILLTENLDIVPIKQQGLFVEQNKEKSKKSLSEKQEAVQPKLAKEKTPSKVISLKMFLEGKSIATIATERGFTPATIEGHLVEFVKTGEIDILNLVSQEKLDVMIPMIKKIISRENSLFAPIKEQLGKNYSYFEIRAAINHLTWKQNQSSEELK